MKKVAFQIRHTVTFPQDFEDSLTKFQEMIKFDPSIVQSVEKRYKKLGYFSKAIQLMINSYVTDNWEEFIKTRKEKKDET